MNATIFQCQTPIEGQKQRHVMASFRKPVKNLKEGDTGMCGLAEHCPRCNGTLKVTRVSAVEGLGWPIGESANLKK